MNLENCIRVNIRKSFKYSVINYKFTSGTLFLERDQVKSHPPSSVKFVT